MTSQSPFVQTCVFAVFACSAFTRRGQEIELSHTRRYLFGPAHQPRHAPRTPSGRLRLRGVTRNNLRDLDVEFPLGVFTSVTGVSGSGKSSLVSQVLVELVGRELGHDVAADEDQGEELERPRAETLGGTITSGMDGVSRLVVVDQKPIGRTPRSNLETYTGLFDHVRKLFAATRAARARHYDAGRFSFNVAKGRCETCSGEGFVRVVADSDWVIDIGPGAGDEGGRVVAAGTPEVIATSGGSRTAPYLARFLDARLTGAGNAAPESRPV